MIDNRSEFGVKIGGKGNCFLIDNPCHIKIRTNGTPPFPVIRRTKLHPDEQIT